MSPPEFLPDVLDRLLRLAGQPLDDSGACRRHPDDGRQLLIGLLALRYDLVTRDALVAATRVWCGDKSKSLGNILLEQGSLAQDEHEMLLTLCDKRLEKYGHDVSAYLASSDSQRTLWEALSLLDPSGDDVNATNFSTLQSVCVGGLRGGEIVEDTPEVGMTCDTQVVQPLSTAGNDAALTLQDVPPEDTQRRYQPEYQPEQMETSRSRNALRVRCPHCQCFVDVSAGEGLHEIACESCGNAFSLTGGSAMDSVATEFAVGGRRRIGRFELTQQLGSGAFGTVWRAYDTQLDRQVAIKVPRQESLDPKEAEKFLREARAAAQLSHPNIVNVHEVGIEDGLIYIVSDFVEGGTLTRHLMTRRVTPREAAEFCLKTANALESAHQCGVIHRDLKPGNIIVDSSGEPHIVDFGLARREAGEITVTLEGQVIGTPAYMSPEQAKGEGHAADRRSDIYSLGVILFQLLTGELPFRGNMQMLMKQLIEDEPPRLRTLNNQVPCDLETICLQCLEKSPSKRYATMKDLAAELERFLQGQPVKSRPVGTIGRMWRWYRRHPDSSAQVAGVYTVLCGILLGAWGLEGVIIYATGIDNSPDSSRAVLEILMATVVIYLPLTVAGFFIIRGSTVAMWIGLAAFAIGLLSVVLGLTQFVQFSGVFRDIRLRIGTFTLLGNLCVIGVLLQSVAVLSRFLSKKE